MIRLFPDSSLILAAPCEAYVHSPSCRFPVNVWNVHEAIVQNLPRTNNSVEEYNNRVSNIFPMHPHIYELLRIELVFGVEANYEIIFNVFVFSTFIKEQTCKLRP
jgi:hypothetical protein